MIASPSTRWVELNGRSVHLAEWQTDATDARPVVLVHGLGGSTINWYLVGQQLADVLQRPVTAIDLIGFGRTPFGDERSTIEANTQLVIDYLERSEPAVVVGSSMGGALAVRAAARAPEHVESLVLVDPALPYPGGVPSARHVRNLAVFATASIPMAGPWIIEARSRRIGAARVVDASLRAACAAPDGIDTDLRAALIELAEWRAREGIASRAYHDATRTMLAYLATGMASDLAQIATPTLLVHGRHDRLVPLVAAQAIARQRAEWALEILECGHLPHLEVPEPFVARVTGWLSGQAADAA
jgi:pimeloyl-ACP methyl ester carboxylesterase